MNLAAGRSIAAISLRSGPFQDYEPNSSNVKPLAQRYESHLAINRLSASVKENKREIPCLRAEEFTVLLSDAEDES